MPQGKPARVRRGAREAIAALALLAAVGQAAAAGDPRPNLLLLLAEDLGPRIRAFGDPVAVTPHLDALAAEGVRHPNTFATAGVCAPSRAALLTGMHAVSLGAQHMRTSDRPAGGYTAVPPASVKAFPERLRAEGYYTFTNDKLDYQFSATPLVGSGPFTIWDEERGGLGGVDRLTEEPPWLGAREGQPFFGLVNLTITHESGVFRPLGSWPHSGMHLVMQVFRALAFGLDRGPGPVAPESVPLPPYYPDTPVVREDLARHYANVTAMDRQVGALLARLAADGLADSTVVVWTTDHGDGLPRAKRELYDSGIRVPMIVRWPEAHRPDGVAPGDVDQRLVSLVDLAPSLLFLAGAPRPPHLHGRRLAALGGAPRNAVFAARDRIGDTPDRQRAVRDARFKLIRSDRPEQPGGHPNGFRDNLELMRELRRLYEAGQLDAAQRRWFEPPGPEQLFDLESDPFELEDVSQDPARAGDLARLRRALAAWTERMGDRDEPEAELVERMWPDGVRPTTPAPHVSLEAGRVHLRSETPGASLGYRVDDGPWQLYTGPFAVKPGTHVAGKAVRYGWHESAEQVLATAR